MYDLSVTAEALRAAAEWATPGEGMAPVELLADDTMLLAVQGDDRAAFDTGGEPGSGQYLAVAPLDRAPARTVDVSDIDGPLAGFLIHEHDDGQQLDCGTCKRKVCDVGDGDEMDTLVRACLDHQHGEVLPGWTAIDLEALLVTAGELWNSTGGEDPYDVLSSAQKTRLDAAARFYRDRMAAAMREIDGLRPGSGT